MGSGAAAMAEDVGVVAAGVLQRVSEDAEAGHVQRPVGERAFVVDGLSYPRDETIVPHSPDGINRRWVKWIANNLAPKGYQALRAPKGFKIILQEASSRTRWILIAGHVRPVRRTGQRMVVDAMITWGPRRFERTNK